MAENQNQSQTGGRSALDPTGEHDPAALADAARKFGTSQAIGKGDEDPKGDHSKSALDDAAEKFRTKD
jgi:hypothetical protein